MVEMSLNFIEEDEEKCEMLLEIIKETFPEK